MAPGAQRTERTEQLAELLGGQPPPALDALTDDELERLVAAIDGARRRHQDEVERAGADVVRHVPLPLRGAVRRLIR